MFFKKNIYFSIIVLFFCFLNSKQKSELTIIGAIDFNGSIDRQCIGLIDCLSEKININFIHTRNPNLKDVKENIKNIILAPFEESAPVVILEVFVSAFNQELIKKTRNSKIKIAYSMFESTRIPKDWVSVLNKHFDVVVVPDEFLIEVYKNSGVNLPIFVIPLGIYIDEFLSLPIKERKENEKLQPFVFGSTTRFDPRKNHRLLIEAFANEFGNDKNVMLKLNSGSSNDGKIYNELQNKVKSLNLNNVLLSNQSLDWDSYIKFLNSFDCYVNISWGEGFSITPREALASGIPCILSDNTAQSTICKTGFVKGVLSEIKEPAYYPHLNSYVGEMFNCNIKDVQKALRDVYENYKTYLSKAVRGREWVKQYRWSALQNKYVNLIKPQKLILGDKNIVTDEYLMTDSLKLYTKYKEVYKN